VFILLSKFETFPRKIRAMLIHIGTAKQTRFILPAEVDA